LPDPPGHYKIEPGRTVTSGRAARYKESGPNGRKVPNYKHQMANKDQVPESKLQTAVAKILDPAARGESIHDRNADALLFLCLFVF
jgi:hypothetical protein